MRHPNRIAATVALLVASASPLAAQAPPPHEHHEPKVSELQTPSSIGSEHRALHRVLERAAREPGALGVAAKRLEAALAPHFKREEEIATPPLGLLPRLAGGNVTEDMRAVLPMTQALERELPAMLEEHEVIRAAVAQFRLAAEAARQQDYVRFSDELAAHARQEEEILYPAAILVGRYVALSLGARAD